MMSDTKMEPQDSSEDDTDKEVDMETEDLRKEDTTTEHEKEVYLPGKPLGEGEELVCDQTAYMMLHQAKTGEPCLSFDVVKDYLGDNRDTYPVTSFLVSGTQSNKLNTIIVMKLSNLHRTNDDEDEDELDDDDETDSKDPQMAAALIKHHGYVNRIRCININDKTLGATWSELHRVHLWDLSPQMHAVDDQALLKKYNQDNIGNSTTPIYTFTGHQDEGFAIDWNNIKRGMLATGDCKMNIHIWHPKDNGSWNVDQRPLVGHTKSVEDIQWSPNEETVLASCSVDKSIRIWDIRAPASKACMLTAEEAHTSDINVISWNHNEPFLVSGGDDGFLHVWDLRRFQEKSPVATFKHHTDSVTTVEWHPTDSAVFASGGSDNQIALWDLSVEKDDEALGEEVEGLPPQLLFIHQGQTDIKELHWHPQIPGVIISTAANGFNIFRTISV